MGDWESDLFAPEVPDSIAPPGPPALKRRGRCPECGAYLLSELYYIGGAGYLLVWECEMSQGIEADCNYRRVK